MADLSGLGNLLATARRDAAFRAHLLRAPVRAAASLGVRLSAAQGSALQRLHLGIRQQAAELLRRSDAPRGGFVTTPKVLPNQPQKAPPEPVKQPDKPKQKRAA